MPGTPASATQAATTVQSPPPKRTDDTDTSLYGPWSAEVFYWLTTTRPFLRGGKAATDFESLDYPGRGKYTPGISLSLPLSRTAMLNLSGFVTKGTSSTTLTQNANLFGTPYTSGDRVSAGYSIKNFKMSFQDLLYPFPRKENQRWRFKTLWEVQYASISTKLNALQTSTSGSTTTTVENPASGSRFVVYPTFGLGAEYHLTPNLEFDVSGSGFMIPHRSTIGDADAKLGYRRGSFELLVAGRFYHFRTSATNAEYFKATLWGPYVALRWYPSKFGVGSSASEPTLESTVEASNKPVKQGPYIRRFTGGASVSVLGFTMIPHATSNVTNTSTVSTVYETKGDSGVSQRIGYGGTAQVALTDHIAVAVGAILRRIGYQFTTTVSTTKTTLVSGVVTPTTTTTSSHEDTRGRLIDIPAVVRYYGRGRYTRGVHWFLEGGGSLREAISIRSSLSTTDSTGAVTCCNNMAAMPAHKNAHGLVAGAGIVLIDSVGIRVIPEVRYTRWMNPIFDAFTTHTQHNELSAGLTLSF